MQVLFTAYLDRLEFLFQEVTNAIDGLPQPALDWSPGAELNSIAVLAAHLAGSTRFWIGDVVGGAPSARDRAAEFRTTGQSAGDLRQRLAETLDHIRSVLETLTVQDLERTCHSPADGRSFSVAWALLHALEHVAIHAGHVQLMRQLWERQS